MRPLAALLFTLAAAAAGAQQAPDYQASVTVQDQAPGTRDKALRDTLGAVAARVGGLGKATSQLEPVLARASQLVQHYGFEKDASGQLLFTAAFDPRAVDNAVRGIGLPVWGNRGGAVEEVELEIDGIRSGADYARALAALRGTAGVSGVRVIEAEGNRLRLQLRSEGGAARLAGMASLGGVLTRSTGRSGGLAFVLN
ncbi:MAG TPA: DUF2066 domain-containing protein [Solimonas sp.]|nr:DUF2066 domain-containing protein [Solimonas sp.]